MVVFVWAQNSFWILKMGVDLTLSFFLVAIKSKNLTFYPNIKQASNLFLCRTEEENYREHARPKKIYYTNMSVNR